MDFKQLLSKGYSACSRNALFAYRQRTDKLSAHRIKQLLRKGYLLHYERSAGSLHLYKCALINDIFVALPLT